jgi:seryl-tRNA(Sec) selenium transferase
MTTTDWGSIYKELGARPVINATGSVTMLGGSTPAPEVREAMDRADGA